MANPIDEDEAYRRIHAAMSAIGDEPGATVRSDSALRTARRALNMLLLSMVWAQEKGSDDLPGVKDPDDDEARP